MARKNQAVNHMAKRPVAPEAGPAGGNGRRQTFSFTAPTALTVRLVGDFTHWQQQPIQMHKGADGIWRATVELQPGAHHYRFVVDGEWRDDPECSLRAPNPYGSENAVRQVG